MTRITLTFDILLVRRLIVYCTLVLFFEFLDPLRAFFGGSLLGGAAPRKFVNRLLEIFGFLFPILSLRCACASVRLRYFKGVLQLLNLGLE